MKSILAIAIAATLAGCATTSAPKFDTVPAGISNIETKTTDGITDDLLTAGLGKTGIGAAAAPAFANPAAPTAAELRRNAIHANYRALIDATPAGGYGTFYGPATDASEGKIAGIEIIATYGADVTLMVHIPNTFDAKNACIVSASSSGSRGIYGAIGTAGEWGLKRGCAVAYTDKGTGNGVHDLMTDTANVRDGTLSPVAANSFFAAAISADRRAAFNTATPNRVAYKHAHSQVNPEKDWGKHTLAAIRLAFYALNQKFGAGSITPANTIVIASSVSNGAGAALAAAEQDTEGLIDGVAVSEPQVFAGDLGATRVAQGGANVSNAGKQLLDYFSFANLYQPCAALSSQAAGVLAAAFWPPAFAAASEARCEALAAKGLVRGANTAARADDALAKLNAYGWMPETNFLQQSHFRFATNSIVVTYLNTYGRFSPLDNVCGYSFANTNATGDVIAQVANTQRALFAVGNGIPPTAGVNVVVNDSVGGAKWDFLSTSPSTGKADFGLDAALCARSLVTGVDAVTNAPLTGNLKSQGERVREGMQQVALKANLQGKPTIIVSGRNDTLVPVNHAARAYVAKNLANGSGANTRYIEVTNAQHFDTFIAFGAALGYDTRFVPLNVYFHRALDAMYAHLKTGAALPPSQVVRTTPRASGATLAASNVPNWNAAPKNELIVFSGDTLNVPQ